MLTKIQKIIFTFMLLMLVAYIIFVILIAQMQEFIHFVAVLAIMIIALFIIIFLLMKILGKFEKAKTFFDFLSCLYLYFYCYIGCYIFIITFFLKDKGVWLKLFTYSQKLSLVVVFINYFCSFIFFEILLPKKVIYSSNIYYLCPIILFVLIFWGVNKMQEKYEKLNSYSDIISVCTIVIYAIVLSLPQFFMLLFKIGLSAG